MTAKCSKVEKKERIWVTLSPKMFLKRFDYILIDYKVTRVNSSQILIQSQLKNSQFWTNPQTLIAFGHFPKKKN